MKALIVCTLAALGILATTTGGAADSNTGVVRGIVTLPDGTPACGVHVRVQSRYESPWTTQTDNNGAFVFLSVLPGEVTIQFAGIRTRHDVDTDYNESVYRYVHVSANLPTYADTTIPDPPPLDWLRVRSAPFGWRDTQERCAPGDARYALFSAYQTF